MRNTIQGPSSSSCKTDNTIDISSPIHLSRKLSFSLNWREWCLFIPFSVGRRRRESSSRGREIIWIGRHRKFLFIPFFFKRRENEVPHQNVYSNDEEIKSILFIISTCNSSCIHFSIQIHSVSLPLSLTWQWNPMQRNTAREKELEDHSRKWYQSSKCLVFLSPSPCFSGLFPLISRFPSQCFPLNLLPCLSLLFFPWITSLEFFSSPPPITFSLFHTHERLPLLLPFCLLHWTSLSSTHIHPHLRRRRSFLQTSPSLYPSLSASSTVFFFFSRQQTMDRKEKEWEQDERRKET